jgi:hypothetical protein
MYQFPRLDNAVRVIRAISGDWRANAIFIAQAGAPFTVNLAASIAPTSAPALVSGRINFEIQTCRVGNLAQHNGSTRQRSRYKRHSRW